ncbi:putative nucleotidyltransferase [Bacillus ectoiniformans]|uniref:nucleotidyltransferase n=1 Tax=Bacillus ectoiniformans TaxID=1494429 RepID=UPI00195D943A|nr:nucleotidyltransferase [Bacillus ectoiniformans]MBM7647233.1 putative nucleotidyltransferase [Bacillus ectoiniformans]
MKTVGIVVEYNPFHNGHHYHVQEAKRQTGADVVIAVMSGHFLQRGEPALVHKWARTKMALDHGADLVAELPYYFSTQKAEVFSFGAISILQELFCDTFCFGSEDGRIEPFIETEKKIQAASASLEPLIHAYMKEGYSFPKAQTLARNQVFSEGLPLDLSQPNNILGYHYVKANNMLNANMTPYTIKRQAADYHETELGSGTIASATSIRKQLISSGSDHVEPIAAYVPKAVSQQLQDYLTTYRVFHTWERYWPFLQYRLITSTPQDLSLIYEVTEGIEHRLKEAAHHSKSFNEFMEAVKTKRYTWTRIQRMLVHILTNTSREEMLARSKEVEFIRLLGMNTKGRNYLNTIKKDCRLPIISKASAHKKLLAQDLKATEVYALGLPPHSYDSLMLNEYKQSPIIN